MAVRIPDRGRDTRVEQILRDPKRYFAQARERARAEIQAERRGQGAGPGGRPA